MLCMTWRARNILYPFISGPSFSQILYKKSLSHSLEIITAIVRLLVCMCECPLHMTSRKSWRKNTQWTVITLLSLHALIYISPSKLTLFVPAALVMQLWVDVSITGSQYIWQPCIKRPFSLNEALTDAFHPWYQILNEPFLCHNVELTIMWCHMATMALRG